MTNKITDNKKAQLFSIDIVVALVLLLILFVFLISIWNLNTSKLSDNLSSEEMELLSYHITNILFNTKGTPDNWELFPENTTTYGLSKSPNTLDPDKVNAFLSINYNDSKVIFNIERYDYLLKIQDINGNTLNTLGIEPSNQKQSITLTKITKISDEKRIILFTLWQK